MRTKAAMKELPPSLIEKKPLWNPIPVELRDEKTAAIASSSGALSAAAPAAPATANRLYESLIDKVMISSSSGSQFAAPIATTSVAGGGGGVGGSVSLITHIENIISENYPTPSTAAAGISALNRILQPVAGISDLNRIQPPVAVTAPVGFTSQPTMPFISGIAAIPTEKQPTIASYVEPVSPVAIEKQEPKIEPISPAPKTEPVSPAPAPVKYDLEPVSPPASRTAANDIPPIATATSASFAAFSVFSLPPEATLSTPSPGSARSSPWVAPTGKVRI